VSRPLAEPIPYRIGLDLAVAGRLGADGGRVDGPGNESAGRPVYSSDTALAGWRPTDHHPFTIQEVIHARRRVMNMKTLAIAAAVGSMLALGSSPAFSADKTKDKCYGVAKAGQNDCAANGHACAGQAKVDNDPKEWKHVPKDECEKMGGSLQPAAKS
jgi:uncharacterized membrane protein